MIVSHKEVIRFSSKLTRYYWYICYYRDSTAIQLHDKCSNVFR